MTGFGAERKCLARFASGRFQVSAATADESLNLRFQSLSREITTCCSSRGGEFGERIDERRNLTLTDG
jgi:hypothetical protein